jgi:hypothetical protein
MLLRLTEAEPELRHTSGRMLLRLTGAEPGLRHKSDRPIHLIYYKVKKYREIYTHMYTNLCIA